MAGTRILPTGACMRGFISQQLTDRTNAHGCQRCCTAAMASSIRRFCCSDFTESSLRETPRLCEKDHTFSHEMCSRRDSNHQHKRRITHCFTVRMTPPWTKKICSEKSNGRYESHTRDVQSTKTSATPSRSVTCKCLAPPILTQHQKIPRNLARQLNSQLRMHHANTNHKIALRLHAPAACIPCPRECRRIKCTRPQHKPQNCPTPARTSSKRPSPQCMPSNQMHDAKI